MVRIRGPVVDGFTCGVDDGESEAMRETRKLRYP